MSIPQQILDLIDRFDRNVASYRSQGYNETQVRREFVDPFFESLGWDVANKEGYAEAYKDVIHEDAVKIGGCTKAPDYSFRIGGIRKFFVETKKPAINIKGEINPAYQLRRYAWSAKLSLSILTDFEEFAVYDCRFRPKPDDKPGNGRILYLTYRDYATRWNEISSLFSKDAVLKGSFDRFTVSGKGKRGTSEVDGEFLREIETWRDALARNLALRNPRLSVADLNFAVPKTIDRVIFLRMCEDRGIEDYGQLQSLLYGENIYAQLRHLYCLADEKYNSGLFHFSVEKNRSEEPDKLTPNLAIDDKVLKDIVRRLYYPDSPYEFSVLSADILGNVYEQFLGKVIRLTSGHRAVVEDKPEVKKAGGVYYTPAYIVDYIVKNTVGTLCAGKTPKQIARICILDPACGSGSFLIGAYTYLLDFHRKWYEENGSQKHTKEIYQGRGGQWFLTTQEKKRILLNNIYGVDIDSQAVEVSKLSLLLKVLEGENQDTLNRQLKMFRERALPDLGSNIKCGNSLIGPDYYEMQQMTMFDDDKMRRVNAFDWNAEFPEIMKTGGFDAVIGNPPYVFARELLTTDDKRYFVSRYKTIWEKPNTYMLFMERGLDLLAESGVLSLIVPNSWLTVEAGKKLRGIFTTRIDLLMDFLYPVFNGVKVETVIFRTGKASRTKKISCCQIKSMEEFFSPNWIDMSPTSWRLNEGKFYIASTSRFDLIIDRILKQVKRIGDLYDVRSGLQAYEEGKGNPKQIKHDVERHVFDFDYMYDHTTYRYLDGKDIGRYYLLWKSKWLRYGPWLSQPRTMEIFSRPRLLVREITAPLPYCIHGGFCHDIFLNNKSVLNILHDEDNQQSLLFLLGQLNSKLMSVFYKQRAVKSSRTLFPKIVIKDLRTFPCLALDINDKRSSTLVQLTKRAFDLRNQIRDLRAPDDKTRLQRQIDVTDQQIDQLVYELYGLTKEEVAIVEGKMVDSKTVMRDNIDDENTEECNYRYQQAQRQAPEMAKTVQYSGKDSRRPSKGPLGASHPIHEVRERTDEYGPAEDPSEEEERKDREDRIDSTRLFDTPQGPLSYTQVSDHIAVTLADLLEQILQSLPGEIVITSEWVCRCHLKLAGDLFPDWAGRYRDVNVQVGTHAPPPFYEVSGLMRLCCDDLNKRLRHIHVRESTVDTMAGLLAWTDWRFQWIHPFKDFNGRMGRVLLAVLMYKLSLPHIETAPDDPSTRTQYFKALRSADRGDLSPLTELWIDRIAHFLEGEKGGL